MAKQLGKDLDSHKHTKLLAGLPDTQVVTALPNGLYLVRRSASELPVVLYPASVVAAISYEAAKMQWAERRVAMKAHDEVVSLREMLTRNEQHRVRLEREADRSEAEIQVLRKQVRAERIKLDRVQKRRSRGRP